MHRRKNNKQQCMHFAMHQVEKYDTYFATPTTTSIVDKFENTLAHYAAHFNAKKYFSKVDSLVNSLHDAKNIKGMTPVHYLCCRDANVPILQELAKNGSVNWMKKNYADRTPLIYAVKLNQFKVVQFLLSIVSWVECKRYVLWRDNTGRNALHYACTSASKVKILELLLNCFDKHEIVQNMCHCAKYYSMPLYKCDVDSTVKLLIQNYQVSFAELLPFACQARKKNLFLALKKYGFVCTSDDFSLMIRSAFKDAYEQYLNQFCPSMIDIVHALKNGLVCSMRDLFTNDQIAPYTSEIYSSCNYEYSFQVLVSCNIPNPVPIQQAWLKKIKSVMYHESPIYIADLMTWFYKFRRNRTVIFTNRGTFEPFEKCNFADIPNPSIAFDQIKTVFHNKHCSSNYHFARTLADCQITFQVN